MRIMDPYTNSHFTLQPPSAASAMDIDPMADEAGATPDLDIKRETSDGLDGDTSMADIPDLPGTTTTTTAPTPTSTTTTTAPSKSEPRSSLPPFLPQHTDGSPKSTPPKPIPAPRASKKKGTATLVKKTTSRKTGSASRAGKGSRGGSKVASKPPKQQQSATGSSPAPPPSSEAGGEDGDEDDESDHGPYCLCRGPDDHRWMIACDVCEDWFHGECVGVDKAIGEALIVRYVCPLCSDGGVNVTRYKKTCSLEGCFQAARMYDDDLGVGEASKGTEEGYSVFCSDRHAEDWWEALVRALPENKKAGAKGEGLTREKFMGLLGVQTVRKSVEGEEPWHIGRKPFGKDRSFSRFLYCLHFSALITLFCALEMKRLTTLPSRPL